MKKIFSSLFVYAALSLFIFTGCQNINVVDGEYRTAPNVFASETEIMVSIPRINANTKSISVYRYLITGDLLPSNENDFGVNIGIFFQENAPAQGSYSFGDSYAKIGNKYCYRLRYYNSETDIVYSAWSKPIEIKTGLGIDYDLKLKDNSISYDSEEQTIVINSPIQWNDDSATKTETISSFDTTYYIAIKCYEAGFSARENIIGSILVKLTDDQANGEKMKVRTLIPENYLGNDIEIMGLVAILRKKVSDEEADKDKFERYTFTEPASVGYSDKIRCPVIAGPDAIDYL